MRLMLVVGVVVGALLVPGRAEARPVDGAYECVCQTFARYHDGSRALRADWARFVDSPAGLRGNHQAGGQIETRLDLLAKDKQKSEAGCKANEFMEKVCKAFKACVVIAAGTLYLEWVQNGESFWKAEKDALNNCEVALASAFFT